MTPTDDQPQTPPPPGPRRRRPYKRRKAHRAERRANFRCIYCGDEWAMPKGAPHRNKVKYPDVTYNDTTCQRCAFAQFAAQQRQAIRAERR